MPTPVHEARALARRDSLPRRRWRRIVGALVVTILPATFFPAAIAGATEPDEGPSPTEEAPAAVPDDERAAVLGDDWATSDDTLYAAAGDQFAFRILRAEASTGYAWESFVSLAVPSIETDRWIGNYCVTGDGTALAVVYAPREYTNDEVAFSRGGFAAIVDVATGAVTDLGAGSSLAHFNPGCGTADNVVLTSYADDSARTLVTSLHAGAPTELEQVELATQLTSPVVDDGGVLGAVGGAVVRVGADGALSDVAEASGVPYDLTLGGADDLYFIDHIEGEATAKAASTVQSDAGLADATNFASGPVTALGLGRDHASGVYLLGAPSSTQDIPSAVSVVEAPYDAEVSTTGTAALTSVAPVSLEADGSVDAAGPTKSFEIEAKALTTGEDMRFIVPVEVAATESPAEGEPESYTFAGQLRTGAYGSGTSTDVIEAERGCAVPRNDPTNQALQPKPRQVEWAVDQAVSGDLNVARPANWMNLGMPAYSPQGLFPKPTLAGGGQVPAQIMLGILAQESNLWQASVYTTPGVTGNPLIGNYYGSPRNQGEAAFWNVDFENADCGYGVAQVTTGMRLAGRERPGDGAALPYNQQRAIALDFAANIAKGLQMVGEKWNETRAAGMIVNDGSSEYLENWFFAIWAYNTGFYPNPGDGGPWGVGWLNNPANPIYDQARTPFLDGNPSDAAHPQDWPYPEKVLGFAAHSLELYEDDETLVAGFRTAWWTESDGEGGEVNRANVKPPATLFCTAANNCSPGATQQPSDPEDPPGPCLHQNSSGQYDLKCWYHGSATWKADCSEECGREFIRFDPGWEYQGDAASFAPNCSTSGLPAGSLVVDNLPNGQPSARKNCAPVGSSGSFGFNFASDSAGNYPSKMDVHQLGGGLNGHFYFAHTRSTGPGGSLFGGKLGVTGTWTLNQPLTQWTRVMVHMPDHGAWTQQTSYTVNLGNGQSKTRTLLQRHYANSWVSLGVFAMAGTPSVSLSNITRDGDGIDDIAWDAVAFQPLAAKPTDFVVSMGDSFSSGEGAPAAGTAPYYRATDHHGTMEFGEEESRFRNGCHRSSEAWSRKAVLPTNSSASVGQRADNWSSDLDYQFIACSGAEAKHLIPSTVADGDGVFGLGQYGQLSQMDQGFLDENTTLVTLSIGGNDTGFSKIIEKCMFTVGALCKDQQLDGESSSLEVSIANKTGSIVPASVSIVLEQIKLRAPNATIAILGYPKLFETGSTCVLIADEDRPWLNTVADDLNAAISASAAAADSPAQRVVFGDPTAAFSGRNLCTTDRAINGMIFDFTDGDKPIIAVPKAGTDLQVGVSQQSIHPNTAGTSLYKTVLEAALAGTYP